MRLPLGGVVGHIAAGEARDAKDERQVAADVAQHDGQGIACKILYIL